MPDPIIVPPDQQGGILTRITDGMHVYDPEGNEIGKVKRVVMGESNRAADERGTGTATAVPVTGGDVGVAGQSLIQDMSAAFREDDAIPDTIRKRLGREGYLVIDTKGLFASDRYALADQVDSVEGDRVRLRVSRDQLIHI